MDHHRGDLLEKRAQGIAHQHVVLVPFQIPRSAHEHAPGEFVHGHLAIPGLRLRGARARANRYSCFKNAWPSSETFQCRSLEAFETGPRIVPERGETK